jgi:hypothetical protein
MPQISMTAFLGVAAVGTASAAKRQVLHAPGGSQLRMPTTFVA